MARHVEREGDDDASCADEAWEYASTLDQTFEPYYTETTADDDEGEDEGEGYAVDFSHNWEGTLLDSSEYGGYVQPVDDDEQSDEDLCDADEQPLIQQLGTLGWTIFQRLHDAEFVEIEFISGFLGSLMEFFLTQLHHCRSPCSMQCSLQDVDNEPNNILLSLISCFPSLTELSVLLHDDYPLNTKDWTTFKAILDMLDAYFAKFDGPFFTTYRDVLLPLMIRFYETIPSNELCSATAHIKAILCYIPACEVFAKDTFSICHTRQAYLLHFNDKLRRMRNMCDMTSTQLYIR